MSEDTVMLAMAEIMKQMRELTDRMSRMEHARSEDAQRIDAHRLFIQRFFFATPALSRVIPENEEFATIRAELARRKQGESQQ